MPESKEELKNLLKEESEKASLKLNIKKTLPWHLVPSLHGKYKGKRGSSDKPLGLSDHCSHEIRRRLLLGRKAVTNLDNVLKSKGVTLLTKIQIVNTVVRLWPFQ